MRLRWSDLRPGDMFLPGDDYVDRTPYLVVAVALRREDPEAGAGEFGIEVVSVRGERRQWWTPAGRVPYFDDALIGRIET